MEERIMLKDYSKWTPIKSKIHNKDLIPVGFKEREIWVCNLGENVGFEEDGKGKDFTRPVLILKIHSRKLCYIVPLSTTSNRGKYYYNFNGKTGKVSVALLGQSRVIGTARLRNKIGKASKEDFEEIKKRIFEILS